MRQNEFINYQYFESKVIKKTKDNNENIDLDLNYLRRIKNNYQIK